VNWQHQPLLYLSLAAALLAAMMVRYGWRRRERPSAGIFIAAQVLVMEMALAHALQLSYTGLELAMLASRIQMVGVAVIPVLFIAAVAPGSVRRSRLAVAPLLVLCIVPLITLNLYLVESPPNAMLQAAWIDRSGPYAGLVLQPGPWFWVHSVYSYGLVLAGLILVGERLVRLPAPYRTRPLLSLAILFVVNLGHIGVNISLLEGRSSDLMSSATIMGLAVAMWAAFYYNIFDILPLARDQVLQNLPVGVITLDALDQVLDANPAAISFLGVPLARLVHRPAREALAVLPPLVAALDGGAEASIELGNSDAPLQPYEVTTIQVRSPRGVLNGTALVIRDMSPELEARARLRELASHIPVCAWCGQARTPDGSWEPLADWLRHEGGMILSHGICEDCRQHYEQDPNWAPTMPKRRPRPRGPRLG
jgi:PAS domain-containing protein